MSAQVPSDFLHYQRELKRHSKQVSEALRPFLRGIETFGSTLSLIQSDLTKVTRSLDLGALQVAEQAAQLFESARRWHDANTRVLAVLAPRGWLISPNLPARISFDLLRTYESGGIDRVEEELAEGFDDEVCTLIIESLSGNGMLADWLPALRKALRAHTHGDYELAIPIWLIAIDGICRSELAGVNVFGLQSARGRAAETLRNRILTRMGVTQAEVHFNLQGAEVDALLTVFTGMSGKGGAAVLNRHAILHGERPAIGSKRDSVQSIIVLEVIYWLLTLRSVDRAIEDDSSEQTAESR
jgi:hypothetical protein